MEPKNSSYQLKATIIKIRFMNIASICDTKIFYDNMLIEYEI